MESAKLSSKSQITVPREVRAQLRVGCGDRLSFEPTGDGRFLVTKAEALRRSDGAARRRMGAAASRSCAATDEAIVRSVSEDDRRIRAGR